MELNYLASILNSTLRSSTPVLLAALGSLLCVKVKIFNIALEGQILIACFVSVVVNYLTQNIVLATLAGVLAGALVGLIVGILQVKYQAADMVVGTSINILVSAITSILLFSILGVKGSFSSPALIPLKKINFGFLKFSPFIARVFENLTVIDYSSYVIAIIIYIYLFKTVSGFRKLTIGVNEKAAASLGIKTQSSQIIMVVVSGALCGLAGVVLALGQVTLFTENMTAGRGFIAMAAASMANNHPLFSVASSLFFGLAQGFGATLQNIIPSQLTMTFPYIFTIIALIVFRKRTKI